MLRSFRQVEKITKLAADFAKVNYNQSKYPYATATKNNIYMRSRLDGKIATGDSER